MNPIEIYLNKSQFKKYSTGKSFQLTKPQIESDKGGYQVSIELSKKDFKNLKPLKSGIRFRTVEKCAFQYLCTKETKS